MVFDEILNEIEKYDTITIYRHTNPDCDAVGSQFALKEWIQLNYPNKKVYALGNESCSQSTWPKSDVVDDEVVKESLGIAVDCSDLRRVDDERFATTKLKIKMDHHPNVDAYGDIQHVDTEAAATCEIMTNFFQYTDKEMNDLIALYLYRGLLTDTMQFSTSNTTNNTLMVAAYLTTFNLPIADINRDLFDVTLENFEFSNYVRNSLTYSDSGFAYLVLNKNDLEAWNLTPSRARKSIDEYGNVLEFEVWAMFTENEKGLYDGSLRSKKLVVNELASKYHGGGHANAAGVNGLTNEELEQILEDLAQLCAKIN